MLEALDERAVDDCAQKVRELASLASLVTGTAESPWVGAVITSSEQLRAAVERTRRLANEHWPAWESALAPLLAECPVRHPVVVAHAPKLLDALSAIQRTLADNSDGLFRAELSRLATALAPAKSGLGAFLATLFNPPYRQALREVRALHTGGPLPGRNALALIEQAQEQLAARQAVTSVASQVEA